MVVPISTPLRYTRYPKTATLSVEPSHAIFTCPTFDDVTTRFAGVVGALVSPGFEETFGTLGGDVGDGDFVTTFFTGDSACEIAGGGVAPGGIAFGAASSGGEIFVPPCEATPPASIILSGGVYVFARYIPQPVKNIRRNVAM